jgi:diguanylate cyclase (GGDEF)-like protein/PAS domain S-box-containing protein
MQVQRPDSPQRPPRASRPLVVYLWALIFCSVGPLLALQAYTVARSALDQTRLAEIRAERATHELADLLDRKLAEMEAGLAVLADAPPLLHGNLDLYARAAYDFARHNGVDVELIDAGGQQLFDSAVPPGHPLQRTAHPREVDDALRSGRMQIVDAFGGAAGAARRAGMAHPVRIEGRHTYVLVATWSLPGIAASLTASPLPDTWAATIVDRGGVRLWRHATPEHPELVGKALLPSFIRALNEHPEQHRENTLASNDAETMVNFTSKLERAPWMAIVAVPKTELTAPYRRAVMLMSSAGVAALLLALALAGWLARKVQGEVRAAAALARDGAQAGAPRLGISELRDLAQAILDADHARISAEQALRASEERWKFALEGAGDGVWDWNVQTGELVLSPRWLAMLGYASYEAGTHIHSWREHVHPDDLPAVRAVIRRYLKGEITSHRLEYRMQHKHDSWVWMVSRGMLATRTPAGAPLRLIGTNTDITERKRMEDELQQLATTDFLTGLANRRCFIARLEEENGRLRRVPGAQACVLMLDLDHFKQINDTHGHGAGDAVLCQFADLLKETPRKSDFVSRLGGEEFAVLLSGATLEEALAAAGRLCSQVAHTPMYCEGANFPLTVSIGVAVMRADDASAGLVLSRADAALYRAKHGGRNRVETLDAA